jgi:hypothetical protein
MRRGKGEREERRVKRMRWRSRADKRRGGVWEKHSHMVNWQMMMIKI